MSQAASDSRGGPCPLVVQAEPLDPAAVAWLRERARVVAVSTGAELATELGEAEGLIVRTYTRVDGALLSGAPRLRVVGRAGVGLDNIDIAACRERGVEVVHTPGANTRAVVEYVFALLLDELRPRPTIRDVGVDWAETRRSSIGQRELAGSTLGILGLGRIGSQVARAAAGLDMRVLYHDLREIPEDGRFGATPVGLADLLAESDMLTVHVDSRASNRNLIDADVLGRTKPDVVLVNASRGFVVEGAALAAFLRANPSARAILDVHEPEPIEAESPLLGLANARLLPHLGGATAPAHRAMSDVVQDVWRVLRGERPRFPAPPA